MCSSCLVATSSSSGGWRSPGQGSCCTSSAQAVEPGLGAGVPRSEMVLQPTAEGVAVCCQQDGHEMASFPRTCCGTGSVKFVFIDTMSTHPSVDLASFNLTTSHMEAALRFVSLHDLSILPFPHNGPHLLRFDIFIELPLRKPEPVLTGTVNAVSRRHATYGVYGVVHTQP